MIYEFALLGRPIAFLAPDDGAYDEERGFYFDFRREAPGPIVDTTAELAALIRADAFDLDRVAAFAAGVVRRARGRRHAAADRRGAAAGARRRRGAGAGPRGPAAAHACRRVRRQVPAR